MTRKAPGTTARARAAKRRKRLNAETLVKIQVRERDGAICRCCRTRRAESVHEIVPKSLGGKVSLENSLHLCGDGVRGCHGFIQRHEIVLSHYREGFPANANGQPMCIQAKTAAAKRWLGLPGDWIIRP